MGLTAGWGCVLWFCLGGVSCVCVDLCKFGGSWVTSFGCLVGSLFVARFGCVRGGWGCLLSVTILRLDFLTVVVW